MYGHRTPVNKTFKETQMALCGEVVQLACPDQT